MERNDEETVDQLMSRIWREVRREEKEREKQKAIQLDPISPELLSLADLGKKLMAQMEADQRGDDIFDDDVLC